MLEHLLLPRIKDAWNQGLKWDERTVHQKIQISKLHTKENWLHLKLRFSTPLWEGPTQSVYDDGYWTRNKSRSNFMLVFIKARLKNEQTWRFPVRWNFHREKQTLMIVQLVLSLISIKFFWEPWTFSCIKDYIGISNFRKCAHESLLLLPTVYFALKSFFK